ncbi:MAG: ASCH domain-containing protein [Bacteriovoracaceae bacterium]|nr:ASCH domain-containing protein [Bacteriovoracaceae bacterium]
MDKNELEYWNSYLETLEVIPEDPKVEVGIAGNPEIADELLNLYLKGKKTAGSGLVKDYELAKDLLPEVGNFWIILNSKNEPKCIVKTVRVKFYQFDQVPQEVAYAEGEGDLSLDHWKKAHREFFTPFLQKWGISDLDKETVVTEFYEVVYK